MRHQQCMLQHKTSTGIAGNRNYNTSTVYKATGEELFPNYVQVLPHYVHDYNLVLAQSSFDTYIIAI